MHDNPDMIRYMNIFVSISVAITIGLGVFFACVIAHQTGIDKQVAYGEAYAEMVAQGARGDKTSSPEEQPKGNNK